MKSKRNQKAANGERPAKATQRRAKSSEKKKGVETGRRVSSVKASAKDVIAKIKAQSRPRIARASKDEVVMHNRLVKCSSHFWPTPTFLGKRLPSPYRRYVLVSFYFYDNHRGKRRMVGLLRDDLKVKATSYARFVYQIVHGKLPKHLHVDHIDGIPLNDRLSNLQPLTQTENSAKATEQSGSTSWMVDLKCYVCANVFTLPRNNTVLGGHPTILKGCSRSCGGKISHLELTDAQKMKLFRKSIVREHQYPVAFGSRSHSAVVHKLKKK